MCLYQFKNDLKKERDIVLDTIIPTSECQLLFTTPDGFEIYEYDILFHQVNKTLCYFYFNQNHQLCENNVSVTTGKKSQNAKLINNTEYSVTLNSDIYKLTEINYKENLIKPIAYKIIARYSRHKKLRYYRRFEYYVHPSHVELMTELNIPIIKSRKKDIVIQKRAFAAIMSEFGYIDTYIGLLLKMDRTSIIHHIALHKSYIRHNNYKEYLDIYNDLKAAAEESNKKRNLINLSIRRYFKPNAGAKKND
jgi:hypothetical protein